MRVATLLIGCLLIAPVLLAQGTQSAVSGVVRDELGRPLLEALVVIDADSNPLRARTDAEGRFRIAGVSVGRHEIRVVRIGYAPHSRVIDVGPDGLELTIEMRSVPIPLDTVAVRVSRLGLHGLVATRGMELMPHEPRPLPLERSGCQTSHRCYPSFRSSCALQATCLYIEYTYLSAPCH